ncbi:MAG: protein kinase [Terriglobales bacterium]
MLVGQGPQPIFSCSSREFRSAFLVRALRGCDLRKLGKYELLEELGRGAFGIVYRARDPILNRMVALKTMTTSVADNPNLLERFYREAQSAGSLQHPNIVTIHDLGDEGGTPFIAMELVDGQNLDQLIEKRSAVPVSLKLVYSVQACRAFDYAHKRGIIHRDIKPGNVMVNKEGTVKVVDFGIARVLEASKTQTGTLIGTFSYMAPELFHGERATERSDIWSFGVLLYELLAYKAPFSGQSAAALMQSICLQQPVPLRQVAPDCPEDLELVVHRTLQKSEAERFQTMEDLLLELDPIRKRLQAETIAGILEQGRQFMEQGEFAQARDLLRNALQVDATNIQARALSEKANAGLKRLSVRTKAQQHVDKGRALLQERKLQEASAEADNALELDSQFEPAHELQQEVKREIERRQQVRDYLESAKQQLAEGLPDEAEAVLLKATEADPSNQQLLALQQQVLEEKQRRQRRVKLQEGMQQARVLWTRREYQECLAVLTRLQQAFPGEDAIIRLLETAREDQDEQAKQEKLAEAHDLLVARRYEECVAALMKLQQEFPKEDEIGRLLDTAREDQVEHEKKQKLAAARDLLAAQRFADALALLDSLLAIDPKDSAVLKLRTLAQREQETQAKSETWQHEWQILKQLVAEKDYASVVSRAENLLRQFPGEADLVRLVEFARNQQAQMANDLRLRSARDQVQEFFQANRFGEAAAAARSGLESFPGDADLTTLLKRAQARQKKEMVRQLIERRIREIKGKINRGQLSEAKELARETLTTLGPDTDVHQLLSSAEVEYEAREKKRGQEQRLETVRALVRSGRLEDAATALDEIFKSGDFDALDPRLYEAADAIAAAREAAGASTASILTAEPKDSAKEYVMLEGPPSGSVDVSAASSQPVMQPAGAAPDASPARPEVSRPQDQLPANAAAQAELNQAAIDRAARMLARYIGPISGVLAKRAAQQADSLRTLYLLLAEDVESPAERARFLRDAGFSDL